MRNIEKESCDVSPHNFLFDLLYQWYIFKQRQYLEDQIGSVTPSW